MESHKLFVGIIGWGEHDGFLLLLVEERHVFEYDGEVDKKMDITVMILLLEIVEVIERIYLQPLEHRSQQLLDAYNSQGVSHDDCYFGNVMHWSIVMVIGHNLTVDMSIRLLTMA